MSDPTIADFYRFGGLNPSTELLTTRQVAITQVLDEMTSGRILSLARLYMGLANDEDSSWFGEIFSASDVSFSLVENGREVAVIASFILWTTLVDGNSLAGVSLLALAFCKKRTPVLYPEFVDKVAQELTRTAVQNRSRVATDSQQIKQPGKSKTPPLIEQLITTPDWGKLAEILKTSNGETLDNLKSIATQVTGVITPLLVQMGNLQEEVDILWWYLGRTSIVLDRPLEDIEGNLLPVVAGIDMALLTTTLPGAVAVPALLQRVLKREPKKGQEDGLTIEQAIEHLPEGVFGRVSTPEHLSKLNDFCPVLTAIQKSDEIGGKAWHGAFKKATRLDPNIKVTTLQLAMQVYREVLLLRTIGGE